MIHLKLYQNNTICAVSISKKQVRQHDISDRQNYFFALFFDTADAAFWAVLACFADVFAFDDTVFVLADFALETADFDDSGAFSFAFKGADFLQ